ncbi:MAG: Gfo/Idh/MocA family oxidoreductase [Spirochaetes bacterium]|nr:Gfo/Idh/MocA family oxidoreductase [Spirochaetota bacterium]
MKKRIAFAGMRHGHSAGLYRLIQKRDDLEIVAVAEDDPAAAGAILKDIPLTHPSIDALFKDAGAFDFVAIGDYFSRRGGLVKRALEAGKHVIADKPLCTRLEEWEEIRALAGKKQLAVGAQFDLRDLAPMQTIKKLLAERTLGRVHTVNFTGQHPLNWGSRPGWYFEAGKHGGTINDIAIHAVDFIHWVLGTPFAEVIAARAWNERLPQAPQFEVCAQLMARLGDGAGVLGDVSYMAPDSQGFTAPHYWRFTFHGEKGVLETSTTLPDVKLWMDGEKEARSVPFAPARPGLHLDDFLADAAGNPPADGLSTRSVLEATRVALCMQEAAGKKKGWMAL